MKGSIMKFRPLSCVILITVNLLICGSAVTISKPSDWKQGQVASRRAVAHAAHVSAPTAGKDWQIPAMELELAYVAPSSFQMGSNNRRTDGTTDEKPIRTVRISRGYWMGKHEVTQQQYQSIMGDNPSKIKGASHPVTSVSWNDAVSYCETLTNRERQASRLPEGYAYRLPTEAEWEYAARGGSHGRNTQYAGSNSIGDVAWYRENSEGKTHPVGQKQANELGLYDMSGNVWEWCHDWYGSYSSVSRTDPTGPDVGSFRANRGGTWEHFAWYCRVAFRSSYSPTRPYYNLGFRVVLAASGVESAMP
jgi:formylglycine-generating enzyme required for sulfatase activity